MNENESTCSGICLLATLLSIPSDKLGCHHFAELVAIEVSQEGGTGRKKPGTNRMSPNRTRVVEPSATWFEVHLFDAERGSDPVHRLT